MKTKDFLNLLEQNKSKELVFEYAPGKFIPGDYHLTEIKKVNIQSIDCGGNLHKENQTVVQVKANGNSTEKTGMIISKTNGIFSKGISALQLDPEAEILFEYGNDVFATSQYKIMETIIEGNNLTLKLFVPPTICKPAQDTFKALNISCC